MRNSVAVLIYEDDLHITIMNITEPQDTSIDGLKYLRRISNSLLPRFAFIHDDFLNLFSQEVLAICPENRTVLLKRTGTGMYISLSHAATISCPDMVAFVDVFVFAIFDSFDGHFVLFDRWVCCYMKK